MPQIEPPSSSQLCTRLLLTALLRNGHSVSCSWHVALGMLLLAQVQKNNYSAGEQSVATNRTDARLMQHDLLHAT